MEQTLISVGELCSTLGIGRTKAYELINQGQIRTRKIGRRRLALRDSVKQFALGLPAGAE